MEPEKTLKELIKDVHDNTLQRIKQYEEEINRSRAIYFATNRAMAILIKERINGKTKAGKREMEHIAYVLTKNGIKIQ